MTNQGINELIPWMKRGGLIATALSAVITAKFGFALGEDTISAFAIAGLLALATFLVGYSLVAAHAAFRQGMPVVGAVACGLFAIAVLVEFISHTSFTAANRDATTAEAQISQTTYSTNTQSVANAQRDLDRLTSRAAWMTTAIDGRPVRPVDAVDADIANSKAHKFWKTTEGCTTTKGPQTRAHCATHAKLEGERAIAMEAPTIKEEIVKAKAELAAARDAASHTKVTHAAGASQGIIFASMANRTMKPTAEQTFWAGVGLSAMLALFAVAAGGLLNFIAYAFDGPAPDNNTGGRTIRAPDQTAIRQAFPSPTMSAVHRAAMAAV